MAETERFQLDEHSRRSAVWLGISKRLEQRLATLRVKNDHSTLNHDETQYLRGQIAEVKFILGIGAEPNIEIEPDDLEEIP